MLTVAAIGLGLMAGAATRSSAALLLYERMLSPEMSGDGTPFEEPEVSPHIPDDSGTIDQGPKKPKTPGGSTPVEMATPYLDPIQRYLRWIVQIRWIA